MEQYGGRSIYQPHPVIMAEINAKADHYLRTKYSAGRYTDPAVMNDVIHCMFGFYESMLADLLPQLASRSFLEFLLHTYDQAAAIEQDHKDGILNDEVSLRWQAYGPVMRRSIKYLAERIVLLEPLNTPRASKRDLVKITDSVMFCTNSMVEMYQHSDLIHIIKGTEAELHINPINIDPFMYIVLESHAVQEMARRIRRDTLYRKNFISGLSIANDPVEHDKYLAAPLRSSIGLSYMEAMGLIKAVIAHSAPPDDGFPICFCLRSEVINQLSRASGIDEVAVVAAIEGFSIARRTMESEGRLLWKPKQEYRSYRRAFYEMPHQLGPHLSWSSLMAQEAMVLLANDLPFKKIPPEWRSSSVDLALDSLSNDAGSWFEEIVKKNLISLGYACAGPIKRHIGRGDARIEIPEAVGELDLFAFSPADELLVLIECKFVRDAIEAKYYRDDLHEFIDSKKSYLRKFQRKIDWVWEKIDHLAMATSSSFGWMIQRVPRRFATAMVTFYPTFASFSMTNIPCVSLTELMLDHGKHGRWPYEVGIYAR